jgi:VIT1/CCC1 family predicted Fe2+/Mn2+ transporter
MMRFELGLETPDPARALKSALTIAASYIVGGMIPLTPYLVLHNSTDALHVSVGGTLMALFIFGYIKGNFTGLKPIRSGFQTALIGGVSATAAFILAQLFK